MKLKLQNTSFILILAQKLKSTVGNYVANEAEQYGRGSNIPIKGFALRKYQDCWQVVKGFVCSKLNLPISDEVTEIAHVIPVRDQVNQTSQLQDSNQERKTVITARFQH